MIAHSSFCNESVVISYGIVGAKIRKTIGISKKIINKNVSKQTTAATGQTTAELSSRFR